MVRKYLFPILIMGFIVFMSVSCSFAESMVNLGQVSGYSDIGYDKNNIYVVSSSPEVVIMVNVISIPASLTLNSFCRENNISKRNGKFISEIIMFNVTTGEYGIIKKELYDNKIRKLWSWELSNLQRIKWVNYNMKHRYFLVVDDIVQNSNSRGIVFKNL